MYIMDGNVTLGPVESSTGIDFRVHDIGHTVRAFALAGIFFTSIILNCFLGLILWRDRKHFSRINLVVFHLMISDLSITFFNIPVDFIWLQTKAFLAGTQVCKVVSFLRQSTLFSSSFVVIVISLDRCMAIVLPLSVRQADFRCKLMLTVAWVASIVCSIPQYFIYTIVSPPWDPTFTQCMDYHIVTDNRIMWHLDFGFIFWMHYVIPLAVLISCYTAILVKIWSRGNGCCLPKKKAMYVFRKSSGDTIPRARKKVMRLTAALTITSFLCWSPYYIMELWYHIRRDELDAGNYIPVWVHEVLFALGNLNVCLDPIMYGFFNIKLCQRCSNKRKSVGSNPNYERIRMFFILRPWRSKSSKGSKGGGSATGKLSATERIS